MGKYVTVDEYKTFTGSTETNNAKIERNIKLAELYAETITKRSFIREEKTITTNGNDRTVIPVNEWIHEINGLNINGHNIDAMYLTHSPYFIVLKHGVFPVGFNNVVITAIVGKYAEIPELVKEAIITIASWPDDTVVTIPKPEAMEYQSQSTGDYSYTLQKGLKTGDAMVDMILRKHTALTGGIT